MEAKMEKLKLFLETNLPDVSRGALNVKNKGRLTIIPTSEKTYGWGTDRSAIKVYPPKKPGQNITWTVKDKTGYSLPHQPSRDYLRATSYIGTILRECTAGSGDFDRVKTGYPEPGQVTLIGLNPMERLVFTINGQPDSKTMHGVLGLILETAE